MAMFLIGAFVLMTSASGFSEGTLSKSRGEKPPVVKVKPGGEKVSPEQSQKFSELMTEGKRLLKEWMDYRAAIEKFNEARALAQTTPEKSDAYYYLSLAYFASLEQRGEKEFTETVKKLIEVDYYRFPDENECPPQYISMYNEIKRSYGLLKVLSNPPGADVYLDESRTSAGKTPLSVGLRAGDVKVRVRKNGKQKKDSLTVVAGQSTNSPVYALTGGSKMIYYILGGAALAAGGGALLLMGGGGNDQPPGPTTGSLEINSNPTGARIFMGKTSADATSQVTPYTFSDLAPGNYIVLLKLDNYPDYSETTTVTAGQKTTVNPTLSKHTIQVTKPAAGEGVPLERQTKIEIEWEVNGSGQTMITNGVRPYGTLASLSRDLLLRSRARARASRSSALSRSRSAAARSRLPGSSAAPSAGILRSQGRVAGPSQAIPRPPSMGAGADRGSGIPSGRETAGMNTAERMQTSSISQFKLFLLSGTDFTTKQEIAKDIAGGKESYTWKVWQSTDVDLQVGEQYKIRVESDTDTKVYGESGAFTVTQNVEYEFERAVDLKGLELYDVYGIAVDRKYIYVTDTGDPMSAGQGKPGIKRLTKANPRVVDKQVVISGGQPFAIDIGGDGNLYVADLRNRQVTKFSTDLKELGRIGRGTIGPKGVAVDNGNNVYVTDYNNLKVKKFDNKGQLAKVIASLSSQNKSIFLTVCNKEKVLYLSDSQSNSVLPFTTAGKGLTAWVGVLPSGTDPLGIDVDSFGNVFVAFLAESGKVENSGVIIFSPKGLKIGGFGSAGEDNRQFKHPTALFVDQLDNDKVYVVDPPGTKVRYIKVWRRK